MMSQLIRQTIQLGAEVKKKAIICQRLPTYLVVCLLANIPEFEAPHSAVATPFFCNVYVLSMGDIEFWLIETKRYP